MIELLSQKGSATLVTRCSHRMDVASPAALVDVPLVDWTRPSAPAT